MKATASCVGSLAILIGCALLARAQDDRVGARQPKQFCTELQQYFAECNSIRGKSLTPEESRTFHERWFERLSRVHESDPEDYNRVAAGHHLSTLAISLDRFEDAYRFLEEELAAAESPAGQRRALMDLGNAATQACYKTHASADAERGLGYFRRARDIEAATDPSPRSADRRRYWDGIQSGEIHAAVANHSMAAKAFEDAAGVLATVTPEEFRAWDTGYPDKNKHQARLLGYAILAYADANDVHAALGVLSKIETVADASYTFENAWQILLKHGDAYRPAADAWVRAHPTNPAVASVANSLAQKAHNDRDFAAAVAYYRMAANVTNCATDQCRQAVESAAANGARLADELSRGTPSKP